MSTIVGTPGDDVIILPGNTPGGTTVTTGTGRDTIRFAPNYFPPTPAVVTDFTVGPNGDVIDARALLPADWDPATNPFTSGLLSVRQEGNDVIVRVGGAFPFDILRLSNVSLSSLTVANFAGFDPTGAPPPPVVFTGTDADDLVSGGGGNDQLTGNGGNDTLSGNSGNDILLGGAGNDRLDGGRDNDRIEGGIGADTLIGGPGDDMLLGGDGDDIIRDEAGSDQIGGGLGNDTIEIIRAIGHATQTLTIDAGAGNDIVVYDNFNPGVATIDLGDGNDRITFDQFGVTRLTLGAGSDRVELNLDGMPAGRLVITDFAAGAGGDVLDISGFLTNYLSIWAGSQISDPFASNYLRLVQDGDDVHLLFSLSPFPGTGELLVTFENVQASALTSFNLGGLNAANSSFGFGGFPASSIIPSPGERPDVAPVTGRITSSPTLIERGGLLYYNYRVDDGSALVGRNLDALFDPFPVQSPQGTMIPTRFEIVNDGTIWLSNAPGTGMQTRLLGRIVDSFVNNGLTVVEAIGAGASAFGFANELRSFVNTGEFFVFNRATGSELGAFLFQGFNGNIEVRNSGLIAIRSESGSAIGIDLVNGGHIVNEVGGRILAEGNSAVAVRSGFSLGPVGIDNRGLIHAVSLNDQPSVAVWLEAEELVNAATGTIRGDIAIYGSGRVDNAGLVDGAVVGQQDGQLHFTNLAGGRIEGNVILGIIGDTLVNQGVIIGAVAMGGGDDTLDNRGGSISGIVDLGLGNDLFHGGSGQDLVAGDNGRDIISGHAGDDLLLGGGGDDRLEGGAGNDGLFGETGNDVIVSQGGDYIDAGSGNDRVELGDYSFALATGGSGFDTLVLANGARSLNLSMAIANGRIQAFEQIEMRGNQRLVIGSADVTALTGAAGELIVSTTGSDSVELVGAWSSSAPVTVNGVTYAVYTLNGARLLVGGAGAVAIVASPNASATGLDAVAGGAPAPLPGDKTGLFPTPLELVVAGLEIREDSRIEREESWFGFGSGVALFSQLDEVDFTIDGRLQVLNRDGARAVGMTFINGSSIEVNGIVSVRSEGPQQFPHPDTFPSQREGAIAIDRAFDVVNNGTIEAISDRGMASAIGWSSYVAGFGAGFPGGPPAGGEDPGIVQARDMVGQLYNHGSIVARAPLGHAFGVTVGYLLNAADAVIDVVGRRVAVGAVTTGDIENHGSITASIAAGGTGHSFGIVVYAGGGYILSAPNSQTGTIINTGIVEAEYALLGSLSSGAGTLVVNNSGELRGRVLLGGEIDRVTNSGLITGPIDLGGGDDVFDGSAGTQFGRIAGGAGNDRITGGNGAEVLVGGAGDDILTGGGNVDTAVISGNRSLYTITQTSTGVFSLVGPDGTDTLTGIEFVQFDDLLIRLIPGTGVSVNFNTADPAIYQSAMNAIRDFDGNALGGNGAWLRIGAADVNGDGDIDQILVNRAIGRFATIGTAPDGLVYFADHGWAGETRVAGIYIDPLVASGQVVAGSANDSQRRFQNDLQIENINRVLGANDYDRDGIQEVFFALTDGTAYLRALMHADGNIRYANYQSQQQVIDYLTANGFGPSTWAGWFPGSAEEVKDAEEDGLPEAAGDAADFGLVMGDGNLLDGLADDPFAWMTGDRGTLHPTLIDPYDVRHSEIFA